MDRKEAIEIVRMCCPKIANSKCDFETAMRVLVPELKESGDERIRREIIDDIQKPAEWSEEDEVKYMAILRALDDCESEWNSNWTEEKNWLSSLKDRVRPHPAWKPTEEQMKAIKHVAEQNRASEIGNILDNLLVELKNM